MSHKYPQQVLQDTFHLSSFKHPQDSIIDALLQKHNTLALLPTGYGKSLCFQIPGLILPGYTIVISPLIALMEDQVLHLRMKNIQAISLNSSHPLKKEEFEAFLQKKELSFVYISPEKLLSPMVYNLVQKYPPTMVIVDEAHCFSLWGHDFRPEYRKLPEFLYSFSQLVPVGLFTATASTRVIQDLQASFSVNSTHTFSASFFRKNLFLSVKNFKLRSQRFLYLCYLIFHKYRKKKTLIYATTREEVETLASALQKYDFEKKIHIEYFHAGREKTEKENIQRDYVEGKIQVLITTNAFGMGIDIPNIECVIHAQMPSCMEHFVQEVGRAGRNGGDAYCELLFHPSDITIQKSLHSSFQALEKMDEYRQKKMCHHKKIRLFFGENISLIPRSCSACEFCCCSCEVLFQTLKKSLSPLNLFLKGKKKPPKTIIEQQKILFNFSVYPEFFSSYLGVGNGIQRKMC